MTPKFWTFVLKVFALFVLVWMLLASLIASLSLIDQSVLLDHKMIVEGIQYHEKKELQRFFHEDGVKLFNLSHMRAIGDRTYTANQKIVDGEVTDETIETTLAEDEVADFEKDWEDNWHPTMASTPYTDNTQIHQSRLLDQKIFIEGVQYHQTVLKKFLREEDGVKMWTVSTMKSIGGQTYTVNLKIRHLGHNENILNDLTTETTLAEDEVADFMSYWYANWHPDTWHPIFDEQSSVMRINYSFRYQNFFE